jgi:hypothetical protein
MVETLLTALLVIVVVLVALWGINELASFDARLKQAINVILVVALVVWLIVFLLRATGS